MSIQKTSLIPLNEDAIRAALTPELNQSLTLHLFESIDSTNRLLKTHPATPGLTLCAAETQTEGRGRFKRHWHSPFGDNLYCSFLWAFNQHPAALSGLSLVVSLAVHQAIQAFTQHDACKDIMIKWPNDLLWQHKKLAGILIEAVPVSPTIHHNQQTNIIIGIGLNVNTIAEENIPIEKPWCALCDIINQSSDRNTLLAILTTTLQQHLKAFSKQGFQAYQNTWQTHDYLYGKNITLSQPHATRTGRAQGVDHLGHLLLMDTEGVMHALSSGDTSVAQENT